jgi:hypothetical protein
MIKLAQSKCETECSRMGLGSLEHQPDETSNYTRYTAPPKLKIPTLPDLLQLSFCLVIKRRILGSFLLWQRQSLCGTY